MNNLKRAASVVLTSALLIAVPARAARRFVAPPELRRVPEKLRMTPEQMRGAFMAVNADLAPAHLVPQCRRRRRQLSAVRICIDAAFQPVACAEEVEKPCSGEFAVRGFRAHQLRDEE